MNLKDHISVREFGKVLGITRQAVSKQIKKNRIKTKKMGIIWIHKSEVAKYKKEISSARR